MNGSHLRKLKVGALPPVVQFGRSFNVTRWNREHPTTLNNQSNAGSAGYRQRRARQLLALLNAGRLDPVAAAGVERDYAVELAALRKGQQ